MSKNDVCVFNIIADDYIPQQQLFSENFKKNHPDVDIYCITLENTKFSSELFKSIPINKIDTIKNLELLKFKYNVLELSTAVKPSIFTYLFRKYGYKKILYFDSDIIVYKPVNKLISKLDNFDAILTPHIRKMIKDNKQPHEVDFSKSGYFNAGFLGLANNLKTLEFLGWWAEKTNKYCYIDFSKFYFVDQRWLDYVPIFLNTYILKEPGYNVAYFNLQEYIGKVDPKKITFMHFSGYDKEKVSVYQNRFNKKSLKEYAVFFDEYHIKINKLKKKKKHLYKYNFFDNYAHISPFIKKIFLNKEIIIENRLNSDKPFSTNIKNNIYSYLNDESQSVPVTNLARLVYNNNLSLQQKFPDIDFSRLSSPSLFTYILWFINESGKELNIDKPFIKSQKQILNEINTILKFYDSFRIKNRLLRFSLRYKYFFQIMKIADRKEFIKNIYLFLLGRTVDQKTLVDSLKNKKNIYDYKKILLNNILDSKEFKALFDKKSSIILKVIKYTYKSICLIALKQEII